MKKFTFIDLFSGIGGFRIALERHGLECVFSSDNDAKVQEAYYENFKEEPFGDITEIREKDIPEHDILCAGFPCQSFSISGLHGGIKDKRGRLFYEIIRIAQYHVPDVLLLENVKNLLTIDGGNVIKTIDAKLNEIGYSVHRHVLNSSYFGVPQSRERIYFVCLRKKEKNGLKLRYKPPKENFKKVYLENILQEAVNDNLYTDRKDIQIFRETEEYALRPIRLGIVNKGGQGERIYSPKGHSITLSAYGGGVGARTGLYLTGKGIRKLSIDECKELMGFPKSHVVSDGINGYKQLGNAVIPEMINYVYNSIEVA